MLPVGCVMHTPLDSLVSEGILDDVLGRLKSGKEAEVFRVVYRGEVIAAKVYKDRQQRSFQHNADYKEGRGVRNTRTARAMAKGSRFGRAQDEDAWKVAEARCLHRLHAAGVRVPTPVMFYEGVLLMELVADGEGEVAPRLIDVDFTPEAAQALYEDLRGQIVRMLCCDIIHGDLSPYNVLLGADGPTIIDFPQAVAAAQNSQSANFFRRDFECIREFCTRFAPALRAHAGDVRDIWRAYERRDLSPDYVPVPAPRQPERPPQPQRTAPPQRPPQPSQPSQRSPQRTPEPYARAPQPPPPPYERAPQPPRASQPQRAPQPQPYDRPPQPQRTPPRTQPSQPQPQRAQAPQPQRAQPPSPQQAQPQQAQPPSPQPQRAHPPVEARTEPPPRRARQSAAPVVTYVKRTGTRESGKS